MSTYSRTLGVVVMGFVVLTTWFSSVEAVLTIKLAEVQNGVAVVQGGKAPANALISWEGTQMTQANKGGNFSFQGVVPADCVGRLEDSVPADAIDVALANCGPVFDAPAPVEQTGQTQCWDINWNPTTCDGTGEDGDYQAGVAWPTPRFTDRGNGTVRDNLTGLIWLKDILCAAQAGSPTWSDALTFANTLASGTCGLTDGSVAGDWRLPNIKELQSLIDFSQENPALPAGHPFPFTIPPGPVRVWSSTTRESSIFKYAWTLDLRDGTTVIFEKASNSSTPWAVRGGN